MPASTISVRYIVTDVDAGKTSTLTLDLKPGTYTYICNIPGHDLLGMKGTLTVK